MSESPSIVPLPVPPELPELSDVRVLVVGDSMLDRYWFGAVDRISPEAPVPVVRVGREERRAGGAANVARNVRSIGAQATLMGLAGDDEAGRELAALLREAGVEPVLSLQANAPTTVKLRIIGRAQQLLRLDFEQPPQAEAVADIVMGFRRLVSLHRCVVFSDYGKGALAAVAEMIECARGAGVPVLVDPKGTDWARYRGAGVITPNRQELQAVVGAWQDEQGLAERAQNLRTQLGLESLVVTRAEEGMTLFDGEGALHVRAEAREVFDVTGAGDTVIAVLGALLGAGWALRDALPWANRAGGIVVGRFGTASVTRGELIAARETGP